jgi:voltage-gated potassium channel Kch
MVAPTVIVVVDGNNVIGHTIVAGYGTMGRGAVETLLANGTVGVLEDLYVAGAGLELVERSVQADEFGGPPGRSTGLPIALIRGATRIPFDDPAFQRTEPGDVVVCVTGRHGSPSTA